MMYTKEDFKGLRDVGRQASECLDLMTSWIEPGISTLDIDLNVKAFADKHNLKCATFGYRGFPAHCCTSVNHVACHGIPSKEKILKDGDIISVDITFINHGGYYGDTCSTFVVGQGTSKKADIVMRTAKGALYAGIEQVKPNARAANIGFAISEFLRSTPCRNAKNYVGHGTGKAFHESPSIPHEARFDEIEFSPLLVPGMVFTIEPIIIYGSGDTKQLHDGWTVVSRDRGLAAQYEHTLGVTEDGVEIFTK